MAKTFEDQWLCLLYTSPPPCDQPQAFCPAIRFPTGQAMGRRAKKPGPGLSQGGPRPLWAALPHLSPASAAFLDILFTPHDLGEASAPGRLPRAQAARPKGQAAPFSAPPAAFAPGQAVQRGERAGPL